jgi:hypothetical protein
MAGGAAGIGRNGERTRRGRQRHGKGGEGRGRYAATAATGLKSKAGTPVGREKGKSSQY